MVEVLHQADDVESYVAIPLSEVAEKFGLEPRLDPETGIEFFLWDNMFQQDAEGIPLPHYTVQETSKVFFARGSDWLRWRYRPATHYPKGYFVLNGVILEPKRTESGNRYYTLADIERMAHALAENSAINGEQLSIIVQIVLYQARLHGVISEESE